MTSSAHLQGENFRLGHCFEPPCLRQLSLAIAVGHPCYLTSFSEWDDLRQLCPTAPAVPTLLGVAPQTGIGSDTCEVIEVVLLELVLAWPFQHLADTTDTKPGRIVMTRAGIERPIEPDLGAPPIG